MFRIPHTFNAGAWHNCMRCDWKWKLSILEWQRGLLLCPFCYDEKPLLGQREIAIARVLTDGKTDFQVDPKLQQPVVDTDDVLMI